jgi:DNA segregation ATPase FtsK/SpoIIIE-like protein
MPPAKDTKKKPAVPADARRASPADPRRKELLREARLLGAGALLVLLLAALLLYDPSAPRGGAVGTVGRFLARWTFAGVGLTAFLLLPLGIYWLGLSFFRRPTTRPWERGVGLLLLAVSFSAGLALWVQTSRYPGLAEFGPGGVLGSLVRDGLLYLTGSFGALLVLIVSFLVGLALFTDWLVFEMAVEALAALRFLGPWLRRTFWPEPATPAPAAAGASSMQAATAVEEVAPPKRRAPKAAAAADEAPEAATPDAPKEPEAKAAPATPVAPVEAAAPSPADEEAAAAAAKQALRERLFGATAAAVPEVVPAVPAAEAVPPAEKPVEEKPRSRRARPAAEVAPEAAAEETPPAPAAAEPDAPAADPEPAAVAPLPRRRPAPAPAAAPAKPEPPKIARKEGSGAYEFPPLDLLDRPRVRETRAEEEHIQENARVLEQSLADFKIDAQVVGYTRGPVVTMYEIALAAGVKVTRIHALADDLAMALKAQSVRVVAPIPGKSTVGVEVPNPTRDDVRMRGLLETTTYRNTKAAIPLLIGVDAGGGHRVEDMATMPHLLIAGATGAGKSVCINSIIMSVLMCRTPDEVRLILVDPKQVELSFFSRIPHLLAPVVTDMKRAASVLEWAVEKMEERYDLLARMQVRGISSYNELGEKKIHERCDKEGLDHDAMPVRLPYFLIVVDELADLMMTAGKEIEVLITRLAQKSRAVGIHVVLATQRPSTDVITGLIKANMPTRICFKVTSKVDSRVVMDQNGGDKLLGQGDMLYLPPRSANLLRAQATFVSDAEVKRVCEFVAERHEQQFNRELTQVCTGALLSADEKDELYDRAVRIVLEEQRGSASLLQRALEIGYTRSSRLLDLMRKEGIVGAYKGSKASEVLCTVEEYEARLVEAGHAPFKDKSDGYDADEEELT